LSSNENKKEKRKRQGKKGDKVGKIKRW